MRIGVDLGGTKIEGVVMQGDAQVVGRQRVPTPTQDYDATVSAVSALVRTLESAVGVRDLPVGIGTPGAVSPATGRMKNCNSTCLNDRPLPQDLEAALGRPVRLANDADCLALSEATDGAATGGGTVFAAILGTGCGGGVVVDGALLAGPNAIAGEWGHNPLPWPRPEWDEVPGPACWHGGRSCLETWISGSGLSRDHEAVTGESRPAADVVERALSGDETASATLSRFEDRLARALSQVINLLDPRIIVLGGGLSQCARLYQSVPALWDAWVFSDRVDTQLTCAAHGDSSGVRGAAWLWPEVDTAA